LGATGPYAVPEYDQSSDVHRSSAVSFLLQDEQMSEAVVYFSCDHRHSAKRALNGFLGAVILQLLCRRPDLEQDPRKMFQNYGSNPENTIRTEFLLNLLIALIRSIGTVTAVVDVLDECNELEDLASK
jgi:hypothetical protein